MECQPAYVAAKPHTHRLTNRFFMDIAVKNNIAHKLPQLWDAFLQRLERIPDRDPHGCYGVLKPIDDTIEELDYWAVAPVQKIDGVSNELDRLIIPAARYARFAHRGRYNSIDLTVNYIYSSWLLRSGMYHTGGCDLEFYGPEYIPDSDGSVVYYSIPIKSA